MIDHDLRTNLISYGDVVPADAPPRLIVFNHIAKTGGTTLSNILRDNLEDKFFNVEDTRDWCKIKAAAESLADSKVLLEGHAWGAHELFPPGRPVFYLTTLRDPVAVFRSNFSYAINHYSAFDGLERYIEGYTTNGMVYSLGYGSLELAKKRLEHSYAAFTVLEEYKESVRQIAHRLEFDVSEYEIKNRSGSESLNLSDKMLGKLRAKMSDDLRLHEFAINLVRKRATELGAAASYKSAVPAVEEKRTETSFPNEHRRRSKLAIELIGKGAYREAIEELKSIQIMDYGVTKSLADCYDRLGEHEQACEWYAKNFERHPSFVFRDYINSLRRWNPERAMAVVDEMLADIDSVLYLETPDQQPFREKNEIIKLKMDILSESRNIEDLEIMCEKYLNELRLRSEKIDEGTVLDNLPFEYVYTLAGIQHNSGKFESSLNTLDHALRTSSWYKSARGYRRNRFQLIIRYVRFGLHHGNFFRPLIYLMTGIIKAPDIFTEMMTDIIKRKIRGAR